MTKLQNQILELVKKHQGHFSAEEIFLLAKQNGINVSMASTYRILNYLDEIGQLHRVSHLKEKDVYDHEPKQHEHLVCKCCGKITDIELKGLKTILQKQTGVEVESFDLAINYICPDCQKKND